MKKLPIGISDFKTVIHEDYYYIDKTLLIKEIVESSGSVLLIPRPRRFGKTLNLSMLKYFFEKTESDNSLFFTNTNIWHEESYRKLQGKYPVIFLTFKDIKETTWEKTFEHFKIIIANEFYRHSSTLLQNLSDFHRVQYQAILDKKAHEVSYSNSLLLLTELLHNHYQKKVIVLIDEYDTPIHASYVHKFYQEIIQFMRSLLTPVLKDNLYLERGILTGILRTAKEGIFSGLNNLNVCSLFDTTFQDKFGFTQSEVVQYLKDYNYLAHLNVVQEWYNGYTIGTIKVYNPWSLLMYGNKQGQLQPYWVNTSDNQIIKKILTGSDSEIKSDFELLLTEKTITKEVDEGIIFPGIEHNEQAIWSLLLFSGYLTYTSCTLERGKKVCNLIIPNEEVKTLYENFIHDIVQQTLKTAKVTALLQALRTGDIHIFETLLQEFVLNSMSMFDLPNNEPEKSYHLFVLGLLVLLSDTYQIKSNRESGYGRYDIMLIPHDKNRSGIIMEFKKVAVTGKETLELAAQRALEQISAKHYAQEMKTLRIKQIQAYGIAFQGKRVLVVASDLS
jgi:hypothetical protein